MAYKRFREYTLYTTKKNAKIFVVGCGIGRNTISLFKKGFKITGIDFVPLMIENAKKIAKESKLKIDHCAGDVNNIKFDENSFCLCSVLKSMRDINFGQRK